MEKKQFVNKIVQYLDFIALITYGFMVSIMVARNARYAVDWGWTWWDLQQKAIAIWIIIAVVKLYFYWKEDVKKSVVATMLLIGVIVGKYLGLNDYVYLVAPMIMFINVPFKRIAKLYAWATGTTLVITVSFSLLGVIPDYYNLTPGRVIPVHHLGFSSHNASMAFWLFFCMAFILSVENIHKRIVVIILELGISLWLYKMTDSLTSTLLIVFFCIVLLLDIVLRYFSKSLSNQFRQITGFLMVGTPIYALVATWAGVMYYNKIGWSPNTLMSRFMLLGRALESVGVKFPNQTIEANEFLTDISFNWLVGTGKASMGGGDGLYGSLLLKDGLLFLVPYIAIQLYIMYKAYQKKTYDILLLQAVIAVFGVSEFCAISVQFCVFAFMAFSKWGEELPEKEINADDKEMNTKECNKHKMLRYTLSGIIVLGFIVLSGLTINQMSQFSYIDSNGFSSSDISVVALQEEPFRQCDIEGNVAGVRLYFDKASMEQSGIVYVDIGLKSNNQVLLHEEFDIHNINVDEEFGGYYDVVSKVAPLYSGSAEFFVDVSVDKNIAGKVNLLYYPWAVKRLVRQIPSTLIAWLIYSALSAFALTEVWKRRFAQEETEHQIETSNQANSVVAVFLFGLMISALASMNDDTLQSSVMKMSLLIFLWVLMFILIGFSNRILEMKALDRLRNDSKFMIVLEGVLQSSVVFLIMRGITVVRIGTISQRIVWLAMEAFVLAGMIFFNDYMKRKSNIDSIVVGLKCILLPMVAYYVGLYVNDAISSFGVLVAAWIEFMIYRYNCDLSSMFAKQMEK